MIHGNQLTDLSRKKSTIGGNASVNTNQHKFFDKSIRINGTSSYLTYTNSMGSQDYTLDYWFYFESGTGVLYSFGGSNSAGGVFANANSANAYYANGYRISYSTALASGWHHCAWVRKNGTTSLFLDGSLKGTTTYNNSYGNSTVIVGYNQSDSGEKFVGYIDEICLRNYAVWTEDFTPPTEPYELATLEDNIVYEDNPLQFTLKDNLALTANFKKSSNAFFKVNGEWVRGQVYVKDNGTWYPGLLYKKVNGDWKLGT